MSEMTNEQFRSLCEDTRRKVFEARTNRAFCPECDSGEVTRLTD